MRLARVPRAQVWALGVSLYKCLFLRDLFGTAGEEKLAILNFDPAKKLADEVRAPRRAWRRSRRARRRLSWAPRALTLPLCMPSVHAQVLPRRRAPSDDGLDLMYELLRGCLTPLASRRPPVVSLLQTLTSRAPASLGGEAVAHRPRGESQAFSEVPAESRHLAGRLVLSGLQVRNLFPKSASGGVKAYVLITCGGVRRLTPIARRGKDASWPTTITLSTHLMRPVEVTRATRRNVPLGRVRRLALGPRPLALGRG